MVCIYVTGLSPTSHMSVSNNSLYSSNPSTPDFDPLAAPIYHNPNNPSNPRGVIINSSHLNGFQLHSDDKFDLSMPNPVNPSSSLNNPFISTISNNPHTGSMKAQMGSDMISNNPYNPNNPNFSLNQTGRDQSTDTSASGGQTYATVRSMYHSVNNPQHQYNHLLNQHQAQPMQQPLNDTQVQLAIYLYIYF